MERRTVPEIGRAVRPVESVDVKGNRPGRRPLGEHFGGLRGLAGEPSFGMLRPRLVEGRVGLAREDADRPPAVPVGFPEQGLDVECAVREHEWGAEREFGQVRVSGLLPGVEREFDQCGAGHHHPVQHGVIGKPRVRGKRKAAGEQHPVALGETDRGGEQRVIRSQQAGRRHIGRRALGRFQPVAFAGERIGRQRGRAGSGVRVEVSPVGQACAGDEFPESGCEGR